MYVSGESSVCGCGYVFVWLQTGELCLCAQGSKHAQNAASVQIAIWVQIAIAPLHRWWDLCMCPERALFVGVWLCVCVAADRRALFVCIERSEHAQNAADRRALFVCTQRSEHAQNALSR